MFFEAEKVKKVHTQYYVKWIIITVHRVSAKFELNRSDFFFHLNLDFYVDNDWEKNKGEYSANEQIIVLQKFELESNNETFFFSIIK